MGWDKKIFNKWKSGKREGKWTKPKAIIYHLPCADWYPASSQAINGKLP